MVGSAVETEDNSRAERKRQIDIERMISQNLAPFLIGVVFDWATLSSLYDGGRVKGGSLKVWDGMRRPYTDLAGMVEQRAPSTKEL